MTNIIGIAGASRSGKDTLCRSLIRVLKEKYDISARRKSLAGDTIKKHLKELLKNNLKIDSFTEDVNEKEIIRPLLVEYGKLLRKKTKGRYFLDNFIKNENEISIIPDIRYVEYPKDEIYWLKNEVNGFLIFIERQNINDANETEAKNNKTIKQIADYHLKWSSLDEKNSKDLEIIDNYALEITEKMNLPLTYGASFCF